MASPFDEKNLIIVFYNPGRGTEFFIYSLPLPEAAKDCVDVSEFGGLTPVRVSRISGEQPGWIYETHHGGSQVTMKVPIGSARDPGVGLAHGIVGVFDRTDNFHLQQMVAACEKARAHFDKHVMRK